MTSVEEIRMQLEWGKDNLNSPQDNLSLEDVEWLLEKVGRFEKALKEIIEVPTHYTNSLPRVRGIAEKALED